VGARWIDSLAADDLDPAFLLWDMARSIDHDALPDGETVLELRFPELDADVGQWWLVLEADEVDVCQDDHGFDVDVAVTASIRPFVRMWRGELGWDDLLRGGTMTLRGPGHLRRQVPDWLELSHFSSVDKPTSDEVGAPG
jgi:hypothetical protein